MPVKHNVKRSDYIHIANGYSDLADGEMVVTRNIELTGPQEGTEVIDRTLYMGDGTGPYTYLPISGAGGGNVTDSLLMTATMLAATPNNPSKQFMVSGRTTVYNRFVYLPALRPYNTQHMIAPQAKAVVNGVYHNATPMVITDTVRARDAATKSTEQYALVFADFNMDRTGIEETGAIDPFQYDCTPRARLLNPLVNVADLPETEADIDYLIANSDTSMSKSSPYIDNLIYAGAVTIPAGWDVNTPSPALSTWDWDPDSTGCVYHPIWELYAEGTDFGRWGRVNPNLVNGDLYDIATPQLVDRPYVSISFGDYHLDSSFEFPDNRYMVSVNVSSYSGSEMQLGEVTISDKTRDGFRINTNGWVDKLVVDWYAIYMTR